MKKGKPQKTRVYLSVELLKSLSKKELEGLAYFTENKYFNTDKDLTALLKQLKKYAFQKEKFSPEIQLKVYTAVFKDFDTKQKELTKKQKDYLTNKLNSLLRLAEQFLMVDAMQGKEQYKFELLYPKLIDKKQFKLQEIKLDYLFQEGLIIKEDNYDELQYHLDIKYLIEKLKYHLAQVNIKDNFVNKQYDLTSFDIIQPFLTQPKYADIPLVKLYLLNIDLVVKQDDNIFRNLLNTLINQNEVIPESFLKIFYTILSNYCVLQIGRGKLDFH